ncbi:hypothetical protein [Chitinimonas sp.]|uniref:hypothetical protein n=1 Tax=Chitinimonas sp. TaxID=1934313 RepID=UPI002F92EDBE
MYADFLTAIKASLPLAPVAIAQQGDGWYAYNPTTTSVDEETPHVLLTQQGALMALNAAGTRVLQTLAFTGGHA